jgi:protein-tyrosine phosphatase
MIVRSDNISSLTQAGVQAMWDYGVSTVVDLRSEGEAAKYPSPFRRPEYGPEYVNLPLVDDALVVELERVPGMAGRYCLILDRRQQAMGGIFSALAQVEGPVVFHCYAGKDRTGLVAAMILSLAGVHDDAIGADYAETDLHLASRYQEWLSAAPAGRLAAVRDELRCPPEWMLGALEHVRGHWGGVEAYLAEAGTSAEDISRLASKLAPGY